MVMKEPPGQYGFVIHMYMKFEDCKGVFLYMSAFQ